MINTFLVVLVNVPSITKLPASVVWLMIQLVTMFLPSTASVTAEQHVVASRGAIRKEKLVDLFSKTQGCKEKKKQEQWSLFFAKFPYS